MEIERFIDSLISLRAILKETEKINAIEKSVREKFKFFSNKKQILGKAKLFWRRIKTTSNNKKKDK